MNPKVQTWYEVKFYCPICTKREVIGKQIYIVCCEQCGHYLYAYRQKVIATEVSKWWHSSEHWEFEAIAIDD